MVAGETEAGDLRVEFDRRLKLELHGSRVISDSGCLPCGSWTLMVNELPLSMRPFFF